MCTEEIQIITGLEGNLHDFLSYCYKIKFDELYPSMSFILAVPVLHGSFTLFRIFSFNYFYISLSSVWQNNKELTPLSEGHFRYLAGTLPL